MTINTEVIIFEWKAQKHFSFLRQRNLSAPLRNYNLGYKILFMLSEIDVIHGPAFNDSLWMGVMTRKTRDLIVLIPRKIA